MKTSLSVWSLSSLQRIYPATEPPRGPSRSAAPGLDLALNERGSFQIAVRHEEASPREIALRAVPSDMLDVRVRRVGYVPMPHHTTNVPRDALDLDGIGMTPGLAPDPLLDETSLLLAGHESHAFWITVTPRRNAEPGRHGLAIEVLSDGKRHHVCRLPVQLYPLKIRPRRNFPVMQWFYVDALLDAYQCPDFNVRFWRVLEAYFRNLTEHGQDTVYVPVFTPPLDGVKRPSQLLRVMKDGKDRYRFDWQDVKRYVQLARRCGIRHFEWTHFFTQWGVKHAIRVYEGQGIGEQRLWRPSTAAVAPTYRAFLTAFMPRFHGFLARENLLRSSFFHVSDEPHGAEHLANYRRARALLKELAPWMNVTDALSDIAYGREKVTDMPIASIATALDFVGDGIPCGCYYCCGPRGRFLNRFIDTPLPKIRMNGWLFYRWPFQRFLHWGYNYWYRRQSRDMIDPYQVTDAHAWPGWAAGDPFVVYPGPDGPVDSMRWEIFAESLRDYALLQTLKIQRDDPLLQPLRSFDDFPKSAAWIRATRRRLLSGKRSEVGTQPGKN